MGQAYQSVRHPIKGGWVLQTVAFSLIRRVSPEVQAVLNAEQVCWTLELVEDAPIIDTDRELYNQTIACIANSTPDLEDVNI